MEYIRIVLEVLPKIIFYLLQDSPMPKLSFALSIAQQPSRCSVQSLCCTEGDERCFDIPRCVGSLVTLLGTPKGAPYSRTPQGLPKTPQGLPSMGPLEGCPSFDPPHICMQVTVRITGICEEGPVGKSPCLSHGFSRRGKCLSWPGLLSRRWMPGLRPHVPSWPCV